jgi:hypothetical protein
MSRLTSSPAAIGDNPENREDVFGPALYQTQIVQCRKLWGMA